MTGKKRKLVGLTAAVTCMAIAVPGIATAKTVKFKLKETDKTVGINYTGKINSSTFGTGTVKGVSTPPKVKYTWKFKGGTISAKIDDGTIKGSNIVGTWKITKGTGKYKKAKGGGKFKAALAAVTFSFTGKVTY